MGSTNQGGMKTQLDISYSVWKQLVQNNSWATYYQQAGSTRSIVWAGTRDRVYRSQADGSEYTDWQTTFSGTATEVVKEDDAVALIVGLTSVIPLPTDPHSGAPIMQMEHVQGDDMPVFAYTPRVGDEEIISTSNLADRCSWFGDSVRVTGETLTVNGSDPTLYESANAWWIDMMTGRLLNEAKWVDSVSHGYQVVVKVDGVEQTIRKFPGDSGTYDCEIYYDTGKVKFLQGSPSGTVTADYSYEDGSTFYLEPDAGKVLKIEKGEADFATGDSDGDFRVIFTTEIDYDIWGYAWYYAPQYPSVRLHASSNVTLSGNQTIDGVAVANGDQVACFNQTTSTEDGMWIVNTSGSWSRSPGMPVGAHVAGYLYFPSEGTTYGKTGQIVANSYPNDVVGTNDITVVQYFSKNDRVQLTVDKYKRASQIIMEAQGAHPRIIAVGATDTQISNLKSSTWTLDEFRRQSRGFVSDVQPIPFPYETVRELESSKGHQLRVSTLGDTPFGGELCTLTFYCTSWDE